MTDVLDLYVDAAFPLTWEVVDSAGTAVTDATLQWKLYDGDTVKVTLNPTHVSDGFYSATFPANAGLTNGKAYDSFTTVNPGSGQAPFYCRCLAGYLTATA